MRGPLAAQTSVDTKFITTKDRKAVSLQQDIRGITQLYLQGALGCTECNILGNVKQQNITSVENVVKC